MDSQIELYPHNQIAYDKLCDMLSQSDREAGSGQPRQAISAPRYERLYVHRPDGQP